MNALKSILCAVCFWLLAIGSSPAEPTSSFQTSYYAIHGESVRELRSSMNREKPKSIARDALTLWNVTWSYSWRQVEGSFELHTPKVTIKSTTTLPRWTPPKDADRQLVERWQKYIQALTAHENGHSAIGLQAARDIEKQLSALPRQSSVEELKQVVEDTCQRFLKEARTKEINYDEQTEHGMKQGARFP